MDPNFAKAIYVKTRESVEDRVRTSLKGVQLRYGKQMERLEREKSDGTYTYNFRLYDRRKAEIQRNLQKESREIRGQADHYLHTLGLAKAPVPVSASTPKTTTFTQVGARAWTKSAAGARLHPLFSGRESLKSREPDSPWNPFLGYIGPLSERAAVRSWIDSQPPSQDIEKGQCFKLDRSPTTTSSIQEAMIYLKLREDGCSKQKSMVYSVKKRCMMDSTVEKDGPACHRTIKVEGNRTEGRNWKGWQLHPPSLALGERFQSMEPQADLREYEMLTKEYERLQAKQQRVKAGMDFEDRDRRRNRYFGRLNKEWEARQSAKKLEKDVDPPSPPPSTSSPILLPSPSVSLSVPATLPPPSLPLPTEPEPCSPNASIQPETALFPSTEDTETDLSTKPTARDLQSSLWLDPILTETFPSGSLVIRSIPPARQSLPAFFPTRKLGKRSRTRLELSDSSPNPSHEASQRLRHKSFKERFDQEKDFFQRPVLPRTLTKLTNTAEGKPAIREIKEQSFSQEVD